MSDVKPASITDLLGILARKNAQLDQALDQRDAEKARADRLEGELLVANAMSAAFDRLKIASERIAELEARIEKAKQLAEAGYTEEAVEVLGDE